MEGLFGTFLGIGRSKTVSVVKELRGSGAKPGDLTGESEPLPKCFFGKKKEIPCKNDPSLA